MNEILIETLEKKAAKLSLQEHIRLMEILARQLREKCLPEKEKLDWAELYGLGKGLWHDEDAQEYVDSVREDRS